MAKPTKQEIKSDLLDQLERNGTVGSYYLDLVDDYMSLWHTKEMLIEDIENRGATVPYNNGGNQYGTKKNESIDQVLKVSKQMLVILDAIGIKPVPVLGGDTSDPGEM